MLRQPSRGHYAIEAPGGGIDVGLEPRGGRSGGGKSAAEVAPGGLSEVGSGLDVISSSGLTVPGQQQAVLILGGPQDERSRIADGHGGKDALAGVEVSAT